jgi:hypothetical protein
MDTLRYILGFLDLLALCIIKFALTLAFIGVIIYIVKAAIKGDM